MTRGWPTFLTLVLLAALVYAAPAAELKWAALAGLAFLSLATLPVGRVRSKQASAGRSSGEAVQTTRERDQSES